MFKNTKNWAISNQAPKRKQGEGSTTIPVMGSRLTRVAFLTEIA